MTKWIKRLQEVAGTCEFFPPKDTRNPAPGHWTIRGPTSELRHSRHSLDHAALLYLVHVCSDPESKEALPTYIPKSEATV